MKKACLVVDAVYCDNKIFDLENKTLNRDNCLHPFYSLKIKMKEKGYNLCTQDVNSINESDIVIYNDMPKEIPKKNEIHKSFLLVFESELIKEDNWDVSKHVFFNKVFTWHDEYVDGKKYYKFNFSQKIDDIICREKISFESMRLCTLISANKKCKHSLELYSKREELIRWFDKNHPKDFEFYGIGWNQYVFKNKYLNFLYSRLKLNVFFNKNYLTYKGSVGNKKETLAHYKFAICFENAKKIPGYITEKIFDCFMSGTVPIYLGASNILEYIPRNCFIDIEDFDSYDDLYNFISTMNEKSYKEYLDAIELYLKSYQIEQFSSDYFAENIVENII